MSQATNSCERANADQQHSATLYTRRHTEDKDPASKGQLELWSEDMLVFSAMREIKATSAVRKPSPASWRILTNGFLDK